MNVFNPVTLKYRFPVVLMPPLYDISYSTGPPVPLLLGCTQLINAHVEPMDVAVKSRGPVGGAIEHQLKK